MKQRRMTTRAKDGVGSFPCLDINQEKWCECVHCRHFHVSVDIHVLYVQAYLHPFPEEAKR